MLQRNALVPYIYTHAFMRTHGSGESLVTPLYWDPAASAHEEAYEAMAQGSYFFGRDLVVSPITEACTWVDENVTFRNGSSRCVATKAVWLPPSDNGGGCQQGWVGWNLWNEVVLPGLQPSREYTMAQMPVYARSGSVIPTRDMNSVYASVADPLIWVIVPCRSGNSTETWNANLGNRLGKEEGSGIQSGGDGGGRGIASVSSELSFINGQGSVYEDDGTTVSYRNGEGIITTLAYTFEYGDRATTWSANISTAGSAFDGMPVSRGQRVALKGIRVLPRGAKCNGETLRATKVGEAPGFWMEPDGLGGVAAGVATARNDSLVVACAPTTPFGVGEEEKSFGIEVVF